ncbi:myosin-like protein [Achlya hypogyna]|uniref:Myosin-like protein n=1 Tax=Achlya hypogyna TaxID=1202772 RepID=A0A1V9ZAI9_ACHHY|nr:myosin-like protein [Achlya hypogyna]
MAGAVEDLTSLVQLDEAAILTTLAARFHSQAIYTRTGAVLIAMNPFTPLPLYGAETKTRYMHHGRKRARGERIDPLPPHIYAIADHAYREMHRGDQSILVSGESGAGKTETTKCILNYVATLVTSATSSDLAQRVLECNPILEAFGNARTNRNNNSSRFGKFIRLEFEAVGSLLGASISTYLLERVRIVSQAIGERNYHIFYELLRGASPNELAALGLSQVQDYKYLNQSQCYDRQDGVDDSEQYAKTRHAMTTIGMSSEEQTDVLQLVAAVLLLGNLEFARKGGEASQLSNDGASVVATVCGLLGIDGTAMEHGLTTKQIKAGGDRITTALSVVEASATRDAVAKTIYARVFDWLVERINESMRYSTSTRRTLTPPRFIGVVDIFGFEIFASNSLEQLCINFANEKLQQLFAKYVFEMEQAEYAAEAIPWSFVEYPNNDACVVMFEARPFGVFSLLDEQCVVPRGNDAQLAAKYADIVAARHRHLSATKLQKAKGLFTVAHYAGPVVYSAIGFCDKNKDHVHSDVLAFLRGSTNAFLASLFPVGVADTGRPTSLTTKFQAQLASLLQVLQATSPHFVRCIKPNDDLRPGLLDGPRVAEQLRCSGILEAATIARSGYPIRMTHAAFLSAYASLAPQAVRGNVDATATAFAELLPPALPPHAQVGRTKVFLLDGLYRLLTGLHRLRTAAARRTVSRALLQCAARRRYHRRQLRAVATLQAFAQILAAKRLLRQKRRQSRVAAGCAAVSRAVCAAWLRRWRATTLALAAQAQAAADAAEEAQAGSDHGNCDDTKTESTRSSLDELEGDDTITSPVIEYDIVWECGRLGIHFAVDADTGRPKVARIHTTLSQCADLHYVSCGDVLVAMNGSVIEPPPNVGQRFSNESIQPIIDRLGTTAKPVRLRLMRLSADPPFLRTTLNGLTFDEYEVLWQRSAFPSLSLDFDFDPVKKYPRVRSTARINAKIPGILSVRPGDHLTHVRDVSTYNKSLQHTLWELNKRGSSTTILRFQRTENNKHENADRLSTGDSLTEFWRNSSVVLSPEPSKQFSFGPADRWSWNPSDEKYWYHIMWTDEDDSLGISMRQPRLRFYLEVTSIKTTGAAHRQRHNPMRQVGLGDAWVCVNHQDIRHIGHDAALRYLREAPKPVLLTFQRHPKNVGNLQSRRNRVSA